MKNVFVAISLVLGLVLAFVVAEVAVRVMNPVPRIQMVRNKGGPQVGEDFSGGIRLYELHGTPVWIETTANPIRARVCEKNGPENQVRIAVFGSSIFYGSSIAETANFSLAMEKELSTRWNRPVCVVNYSQPAYGHDNKLAVAKEELPKFKPHLVVWEIWMNDTSKYVLLGDTAYNVAKLIRGEDGYPSLLGFSGALNRWLLNHSALYEYSAMSFNENKHMGKAEDIWAAYAEEDLSQLLDLAKAEGAEILLATCPPLNKTFESLKKMPPKEYSALTPFLEKRGVPLVHLKNFFGDKTNEEVRIDTCCHYNEMGHRLLATSMADVITTQFPALSP